MAGPAGGVWRDKVMLGVVLTSTGYAVFSLQDAVIKLLVAGYSVWQVMFLRSLVIVVGSLASGGPDLARQAVRSRVFGAMLLRGFVLLAAWLCFYTAARDLQLAELTTVYFAAPVIVTLLAVPLLGERVPVSRWIAVLTGFAGVYVACDPARIGLSLPIALVLAAACLWALAIVLLRRTALDEKTAIQLLINNGFFLAVSAAPLLFLWRTPSLPDLAMLVGVGVIGGGGQFLLYEGMKHAPASIIASFEYTSLVWSFALGFLIWGDVPRSEVFAGAALIIGAGLIIIVGERLGRRPA